MRCVRILNSCIFIPGREGGRDKGIKVRNMIKEELLFRENDHNNHIGLPRLTTEVRSCDGAVTHFWRKRENRREKIVIADAKAKDLETEKENGSEKK